MVLAWRRARGKAAGRNRIARSGQDSIGRVAADWETGADDSGNSKCCSCSYELVAIRPEACTVAWGNCVGYPHQFTVHGQPVCEGAKPTDDRFANQDCVDAIADEIEQSGADITLGYKGNINNSTNHDVILCGSLCPVDVH